MFSRILFLLAFAQTALASPWFTGPLLAPTGKTIPKGHFNFEPYGFYTEYGSPQNFKNVEVNPIISVGINSFMDFQASLPYDYSWVREQHGRGVGDFSLGLGIQALTHKEGSFLPDLRIILQETIPTGRFENLNPLKNGTDQTGFGAYQHIVSFNFQKLFTVGTKHYLRTRFSVAGAFASSVHVEGLNTFGGDETTSGTVHPGNNFSADLAAEFTLTQNWVAVMEALYLHSNFTGFGANMGGVTPSGAAGAVGGKGGDSASLAPAIEYNFTANLGVIAGVWFSVTGPKAAKFISSAVAINYYF
ncbi:MAG: transporter [Tatlockia sp.]|nr:transporter [Tatlockia sp.]